MPLFQHPNFLAFHLQQQSTAQSLSRHAQLYFSRLRDTLTVASPNLSSWSSQLKTLLAPTAAQPDSATIADKIHTLLTTYSTASYTTLCATLLAVIYLIAKYLMTSYRNGFYESRGGRHSPYTSYLQSRTSNLSDYVEYVGANEYMSTQPRYENDHHRHSVARPHYAPAYEADDAPDVLILRYKGSPFELRFVPYAISDGKLYIQDIRHFAAERLHTEPKRLKLLYKRRELVDDSFQAREYGLKQNSEITCVVVDASTGGSGDSRSSSDDETSSAVSNNQSASQHPRRRRPRGQSTARHRSDIEIPTMASQGTHLHPQSAGAGVSRTSRPAERSSGDSLNPNSDYYTRHDRAPSRSRQPSPAPHARTQTQPAPTRISPPLAAPSATLAPSTSAYVDPNSSLGRISALSSVLNTQWLPKCTLFISSPPSDPYAREKEYKLLTEAILAQVILKTDGIDTQGDPEVRTARKALINDANGVLRTLDAVMGKTVSR